MFEQAAGEQLAETGDLDWKQTLPFKLEKAHAEKEKEELCKDVAAMANSGGGLIAYGIAADGQSGRAQKVMPVTMDEKAQLQIRSLAAARIRPIVGGLQLVPLPAPGDPANGVLAVHVPASPSAPHALEGQDVLRFPYRYGPQTVWMREQELERAYGDRFDRRAADHERLAKIIDELTSRLDSGVGAWVVGVAHPRVPRTGLVPDTPRGEIISIIDRAREVSNELIPRGGFFRYGFLDAVEHEALNPRRGLRRWVVRRASPSGPSDQSQGVHVEIHHDGTAVLAAQLNWNAPSDDTALVISELIESAAADLVALTASTARARYIDSPLAVRLDLVQDIDGALPYQAATAYGPLGTPRNTPLPIDGTWRVHRFTPIETEVSATADKSALEEAARDLATDAMHQFGAESIRLLRARPAGGQAS
nr:ATP-binding protein [Jiangella mangrovi]